jgi:hypothetical protein
MRWRAIWSEGPDETNSIGSLAKSAKSAKVGNELIKIRY